MIENLTPIVGRNPGAMTKAEDFNALLQRARNAFPRSVAIQEMPKVHDGGVTFFDLLAKLSILKGAVKADFVTRVHEASEEEARRSDRYRNPLLDR